MAEAVDYDLFEWAALKLVASLATIGWKERTLGKTGEDDADEACLEWATEIASKAREKFDLRLGPARALSVTVNSSRATAGHQDEVRTLLGLRRAISKVCCKSSTPQNNYRSSLFEVTATREQIIFDV